MESRKHKIDGTWTVKTKVDDSDVLDLLQKGDMFYEKSYIDNDVLKDYGHMYFMSGDHRESRRQFTNKVIQDSIKAVERKMREFIRLEDLIDGNKEE